jgi:hypothetical protein
LGDDQEWPPAAKTVHAESATIEGEGAVEAQLLAKNDERCMSEIQWFWCRDPRSDTPLSSDLFPPAPCASRPSTFG